MPVISPHSKSTYRGRLAPSPTGYLHVGHARTFFAAWQRARHAGGTLVMRMEDLDPDRSRAEYAQAALEDLRWLGMDWDEGPDIGGPYAPYAQSERREVYLDAWHKLLQGGFIYPCQCSRKDLAAALSAPHEGVNPDPLDDEPVYPGTCRPGTCRVPQARAPHRRVLVDGVEVSILRPGIRANWRFRVPDGEVIEFDDLNLGPQRFIAGIDFGDFVVWRHDGNPGSPRTLGVPGKRSLLAGVRTGPRPWGGGVPSYQLACVVDDAAMKITEVVRGADLLKSTARQILLNRALGFANPSWFHCNLVVDANGRRLAKRSDALSVRALRNRGLTPQQVFSASLLAEK